MTITKLGDRFFSWASILEDKAREQTIQAATMPFIWPHVAGMPDMHWGVGCSVGAVLPTVGAIIPAAVGVDIGCGMIAAKTMLTKPELAGKDLSELRKLVESIIPMSSGNYNADVFDTYTEKRISSLAEKDGADHASTIAPNWQFQLGTLGGGNHFIEFCTDGSDNVWIFLHSGSRGVGNRLANKHIKLAKKLCDRWFIPLPNPDLAYFIEVSEEFWNYMRDLRWAQHFAQLNREEMLHRCRLAISMWLNTEVELSDIIRCHHNYTEKMPPDLVHSFASRSRAKRHPGQLWLTRKGAIDASVGQRGLIPGSMGTKSYVVTGKGNRLSLWSAPHGAGRNFGRRRAESLFSSADLVREMRDIEWSHEISDKLRDEHPSAYKPLDLVMSDSRELVTIDETLRAFINIKGE